MQLWQTKEHSMTSTSTFAPRHKPYGGLQMEGPIARWYARSTRDRRDHATIAQAIATHLPPGSAILEVAPGPGYLAIELARRGYRVTGLDISHSFVRIASANAHQAGVAADFRHGDVARMPFPDASFDFVVCVAAFKNFPRPVAALDEIYRVLRPGGRASIFDMRKDAPSKAIEQEVRDMHLSPLSARVTGWIFHFGLLRAAYPRDRLETIVGQSRFGQGEIVDDGIGFELRLGWVGTP
jgi:ubiquinone/menaquinone biosynthesis C-methylase UbiE